MGRAGRRRGRHLLRQEAARRCGDPFVTINTVGPTIMRFGTEEQKSFFLPQILAGELNFAIGYTEARGRHRSRLAAPRAVHDGEEYVINGAKIFTSGAVWADYIWLACPGPTPRSRSTRASRFCACPPRRRASSGRSSTPSAA